MLTYLARGSVTRINYLLFLTQSNYHLLAYLYVIVWFLVEIFNAIGICVLINTARKGNVVHMTNQLTIRACDRLVQVGTFVFTREMTLLIHFNLCVRLIFIETMLYAV